LASPPPQLGNHGIVVLDDGTMPEAVHGDEQHVGTRVARQSGHPLCESTRVGVPRAAASFTLLKVFSRRSPESQLSRNTSPGFAADLGLVCCSLQ
jgi:hypothetical protein